MSANSTLLDELAAAASALATVNPTFLVDTILVGEMVLTVTIQLDDDTPGAAAGRSLSLWTNDADAAMSSAEANWWNREIAKAQKQIEKKEAELKAQSIINKALKQFTQRTKVIQGRRSTAAAGFEIPLLQPLVRQAVILIQDLKNLVLGDSVDYVDDIIDNGVVALACILADRLGGSIAANVIFDGLEVLVLLLIAGVLDSTLKVNEVQLVGFDPVPLVGVGVSKSTVVKLGHEVVGGLAILSSRSAAVDELCSKTDNLFIIVVLDDQGHDRGSNLSAINRLVDLELRLEVVVFLAENDKPVISIDALHRIRGSRKPLNIANAGSRDITELNLLGSIPLELNGPSLDGRHSFAHGPSLVGAQVSYQALRGTGCCYALTSTRPCIGLAARLRSPMTAEEKSILMF
ncbi:hypothetical protein HJFPF1_11042 [Paramyrothecium foliicola]|nr:hypothetical protein HJFPF1_11042 [Paramyrothecium foliicola]